MNIFITNTCKKIKSYITSNKLVQKISFIKNETGSATAEYAIIALCSVAFAGILMTVIKGGAVQNLLTTIISKALQLI